MLRRMAPSRKASPLMARLLAVAVSVLAAPGLFQGCSGCTCEHCFTQGVERDVTRDAARDYVYSAPLAETEAAMREVLAQSGYEAPKVNGPAARTSTFATNRTGMPDHELLLQLSPVGANRYRLEASKRLTWPLGDGGSQVTRERDLDVEYDIARRVDPAWAAKVNERVDRKRERARTVGRGCERGCELGCTACETCARAIESTAPRPPDAP